MSRLLFRVEESALDDGITLIEASAGTGKTFNIALAVVRLLLDRHPDGRWRVNGIGGILVVTFTTAATDELVTRIRRVLQLAADCYAEAPVDRRDPEVDKLQRLVRGRMPTRTAYDRIRTALAELDTLAVYTIHAFCKRVLDSHALESGVPYDAALVQDERSLIEEALTDWWRSRAYRDPARAAWLVAQKFTPASLVARYRQWQQWPGARLEPDGSLLEAEAALHDILRGIRDRWDAAGCRDRLAGISWKSGSPFRTPESRDQTLEALTRLWAGDLSQQAALKAFELASLQEYAGKRGSSKQALETLPDWPEVHLANDARRAFDQLSHVVTGDALRYTAGWMTREKRRRVALGFQDLLARLRQVLDTDPDGALVRALRTQYQAALIDEFQDTDDDQFAIFCRLFAERPLILIGDPKQAIYAFRGADLDVYLRAAGEATRRFSLRENYRSTNTMLTAVNRLFERRRQPFLVEGISHEPASPGRTIPPVAGVDPAGASLHWWYLEADAESPWYGKGDARRVALTATVNEILRLLDAGCQPKQMAVLVRAGFEGREVQRMLRQAGVPAVLSGMDDIFASSEMDELALLLTAIHAPKDARVVRAALATVLWGWSYEALRALEEESGTHWEQIIDELTQLEAHWREHGLASVWERWSRQHRVPERLLALEDGERRLTNLRHAIELLHEASQQLRLRPEGLLRWLARERQGLGDDQRTAETAELRLDTDADAVQLLTIHKSKGLEFDIVFLPTLWDAKRPAKPPVLAKEDGRIFDLGSPRLAERLDAANAVRLAEDLRLAYVALTRARHRCYVVWGPVVTGGKGNAALEQDGSVHSALGYLLLDGHPGDQEDSAAGRCRQAAAVLATSVDQWPASLERLVARSEGCMTVTPVSTGLVIGRRTVSYPTGPEPVAHPLPFGAGSERLRTHQVSSYTRLAKAGKGGNGAADDVAPGADAPVADRDDDGLSDQRGVTSTTVRATLSALSPDDFRAFPASAHAGTTLHTLFETVPFTTEPDPLRARVRELVVSAALGGDATDARTEGVARMFEAVGRSPFTCGGPTVRLLDVPRTAQRHEWEFLLPLASADRPLTAHRLAACFETAGTARAQRYARSLRTLELREVHGFLTGFVDLLFEQAGRWYVVDWKSNRLSLEPEAYLQDRLWETMAHSHYVLQYHLYLVAVHRLLRDRLVDYDYDRHVGGAAYAFLRGFGAPDISSTGHGWFTDRPDRVIIEALDAAIGHAPEIGSEIGS